MTERLRWGILGPGVIADIFTNDLAAGGHLVTAVGSRSLESAQVFAAAHHIPNVHGSYEELVADPEVDIVYVATPHPFHAEQAILALNAGKHVLVEKAFTLNEAQARAVVELATEKRLVVLEAMWTRFLPHMVRIRELLAAGALGEIRGLIADHDQKISTDPTHRLQDPNLGGGALLDLGIYPVSFAWDVFGEPSSVYALSSPTPTGVDQNTAIVLGYPGGGKAVLHTTLDARGPSTAVIVGTEARIEIEPVWYNAVSFDLIDPDGAVLEHFDGSVQGRGMQYQAAEIERIITSGELAGTVLPPAESVAIMGTLDEIRRQIGLRYPGE
ncbi:Gfo/Idh/MocA family oxidoreductase [soil metagenome]